MTKNFWGEDPGYHLARAAFVRKQARQGEMRWPAALEILGGHRQGGQERRAARPRAHARSGWSPSRAGRHAA